MREIKFRAWHKGNNEWVEVTKHFGLDGDGSMYLVSMLKPIVLMQSTGLLDKNGKAIFEGDIVEFDGRYFTQEARRGLIGNTAEIIWSSYTASFSVDLIWTSGETEIGGAIETLALRDAGGGISSGDDIGCEDLEIIGSIYENPELLEK